MNQNSGDIMRPTTFVFLVTFLLFNIISAQSKGTYEEYSNSFWKEIESSSEQFSKKKQPVKKVFKADFSEFVIPSSKNEFEFYWHFDPEPYPQGNTGTCWDFCTTSFYESEIYRLRGEKIKISEIYTAYWEFVEKARGYIQTRGKSLFAHGSESNAVKRIMKKYGAVPHEVYTGLLKGQTYHDHSKMFDEMKTYLESRKKINAWNEEETVNNIKSILNHYLGTPPELFEYQGKQYTPHSFLSDIIKLDLDNYVEFQSTIKQPFYEYTELEVPDNWWHNKDYINIPLTEFMRIVKESIRDGYTVCIGGDVSEPGLDGEVEAAVIPAFDIPSDFIDEYSREYRISNYSTEDDHGIHLVGYKEQDGKDWYLIKDSGSSSRNGNNVGYYFYHEDFVKLKMLSFMVHKDMVEDIIAKIK
jgi:bleomycin hydrolase